MTFREKLIKECIEVINRDDVKKELHILFRPFLKVLFRSFSPYIELLILFLGTNFILICVLLYYVKFGNIYN